MNACHWGPSEVRTVGQEPAFRPRQSMCTLAREPTSRPYVRGQNMRLLYFYELVFTTPARPRDGLFDLFL